ncbi:lipoyl(octanoyl) transferase LipB [Solimonas sp. K1W22B-7]|uniref:lipoyl(octanoyl) transferase LipB n=1 Tax=Solimonas sp. K1W22B-7 TaxID=2303331 RepID=UPI000E334A2D|nr:lipoyl(octanoyl) transferase LipB [Solimonas sp. K1W22B-7]AXQ30283.1 lipoyl(octanoyl) transferase LipB [Solimonas sp. K1W22B-7]
MTIPSLIVRHLGRRDYAEVFAEQRAFTDARRPDTPDELWFLEHDPVFTQGQAGKPEHLLLPGDIPVLQSDRGGQVTYHGPGQIVVYLLVDLRRLGYSIRSLVTRIEQSLVATLAVYGIAANADPQAPGVYVDGAKIASLGLRVRQGCSYHGLSLNVDMDLAPFSRINPCGYQGLCMTQVRELGGPADLAAVGTELERQLRRHLDSPDGGV